MMIDILCPTRGRPKLALAMYQSLCKVTRDPKQVRVWFYLSEGDGEAWLYNRIFDENCMRDQDNIRVSFIKGKDAPTCWAWNALAKVACGQGANLLLLMGDDVTFETEGWDEIYRDVYRKHGDGIFVIAPNDGRGDGVPHPCVSARWVGSLGYFVNPVFFHWGVDSYTEHLAKEIGRLIRVDVLLNHQKVGEAHPADETYKRIRAGVWNERDRSVLELMKDRYAEKDIGLLLNTMVLEPGWEAMASI